MRKKTFFDVFFCLIEFLNQRGKEYFELTQNCLLWKSYCLSLASFIILN